MISAEDFKTVLEPEYFPSNYEERFKHLTIGQVFALGRIADSKWFEDLDESALTLATERGFLKIPERTELTIDDDFIKKLYDELTPHPLQSYTREQVREALESLYFDVIHYHEGGIWSFSKLGYKSPIVDEEGKQRLDEEGNEMYIHRSGPRKAAFNHGAKTLNIERFLNRENLPTVATIYDNMLAVFYSQDTKEVTEEFKVELGRELAPIGIALAARRLWYEEEHSGLGDPGKITMVRGLLNWANSYMENANITPPPIYESFRQAVNFFDHLDREIVYTPQK